MITHSIYALLDPRDRRPRYVGKTTRPSRRIRQHINYPNSAGMRRWIAELATLNLFPIMDILEVCHGESWEDRERFHIAQHREKFHELLNVLDGGNELSPCHYTEAVRSKISAANLGKKRSAEVIAKRIGRKLTPEHCANMQAARLKLGWKPSAETRAKMSAAQKGRIVSQKTRAKLSASKKGRVFSQEAKDKMSASRKGKVASPEAREKMSKAKRGRKFSEEHRAKISAAHRGKTLSQETRAKLTGIVRSLETRAKLSAAAKARMSTPEARAAAMVGLHSPEVRAATSARMKKYNAYRKAALLLQ